eukprot:scaffold26027_cov70-Attheya_sp.AAC.6
MQSCRKGVLGDSTTNPNNHLIHDDVHNSGVVGDEIIMRGLHHPGLDIIDPDLLLKQRVDIKGIVI